MENRKIQSKSRYILAFLIGTSIFILGFVITYSISYIEYQRISNVQGLISYEIFRDKLKYSFFGEDVCPSQSIKEVSEDLGFQGRIIDDLERKFGKNDERVLFRKKFYTLILLEHFEFVNTLNKNCKADIPTILFFYSNEEKDAEESEDLGKLLSAVHQRNSQIVIYSFDINLDSEIIAALKEKYSITEPNIIIINNKKKIINPEKIDEIEKFI